MKRTTLISIIIFATSAHAQIDFCKTGDTWSLCSDYSHVNGVTSDNEKLVLELDNSFWKLDPNFKSCRAKGNSVFKDYDVKIDCTQTANSVILQFKQKTKNEDSKETNILLSPLSVPDGADVHVTIHQTPIEFSPIYAGHSCGYHEVWSYYYHRCICQNGYAQSPRIHRCEIIGNRGYYKNLGF